MGVPTSEVGYTSATASRGDHESSYEHVVALEKKKLSFSLHLGLSSAHTAYQGPEVSGIGVASTLQFRASDRVVVT